MKPLILILLGISAVFAEEVKVETVIISAIQQNDVGLLDALIPTESDIASMRSHQSGTAQDLPTPAAVRLSLQADYQKQVSNLRELLKSNGLLDVPAKVVCYKMSNAFGPWEKLDSGVLSTGLSRIDLVNEGKSISVVFTLMKTKDKTLLGSPLMQNTINDEQWQFFRKWTRHIGENAVDDEKACAIIPKIGGIDLAQEVLGGIKEESPGVFRLVSSSATAPQQDSRKLLLHVEEGKIVRAEIKTEK
jgi:hypothetical protein